MKSTEAFDAVKDCDGILKAKKGWMWKKSDADKAYHDFSEDLKNVCKDWQRFVSAHFARKFQKSNWRTETDGLQFAENYQDITVTPIARVRFTTKGITLVCQYWPTSIDDFRAWADRVTKWVKNYEKEGKNEA